MSAGLNQVPSVVQGMGANFLLGAVDYVEHYGLVRGKDTRGRCTPPPAFPSFVLLS